MRILGESIAPGLFGGHFTGTGNRETPSFGEEFFGHPPGGDPIWGNHEHLQCRKGPTQRYEQESSRQVENYGVLFSEQGKGESDSVNIPE